MPFRRAAIIVTSVILLSTGAPAAQPPAPKFPEASEYAVLHGKVSIDMIAPSLIGVVVDPASSKSRPMSYQHLFRLQTARAIQRLRVTLANADVEFRGDELVIIDSGKHCFYVLMLEDAPSRAPRPPVGFTGATYVGYGLNHEIRSSRASAAVVVSASGDGTSCNAGGPHATSSSVNNGHGASSIGCASGSYACCTFGTASTPPSCRCAY
jgi:hypothetical protein